MKNLVMHIVHMVLFYIRFFFIIVYIFFYFIVLLLSFRFHIPLRIDAPDNPMTHLDTIIASKY